MQHLLQQERRHCKVVVVVLPVGQKNGELNTLVPLEHGWPFNLRPINVSFRADSKTQYKIGSELLTELLRSFDTFAQGISKPFLKTKRKREGYSHFYVNLTNENFHGL